MYLYIFSLILYGAILNPAWAQSDYCFGKDKERLQTRHFTTKTAYEKIQNANSDKQYSVPNCTPQKMWIYHRHGTRLPSETFILNAPRLNELRDLIVKNYRVSKTAPTMNALCTEDLIALQMWKWNNSITADKADYLTSQGYKDIEGTAKVYQKYYPNILTKTYNESQYLFRHTDTQRTEESFKAFAHSLFGDNIEANADDIPTEDLLLRPYDYCDDWFDQNVIGEGSENEKFRTSTIWNVTLEDISRRLGFLYTLPYDDIELMYDMCRYEQAWYIDRTSVWCAVFTPPQVSVFEYDDDMKYYYKSGYGNLLNSHLSCFAFQDMVGHFSTLKQPNAIIYFGHSAGLQALITALGLYKDDTSLSAHNYESLQDRKWRISNIDPFAANFVAVKYMCDREEKVMFFLNQKAVDFDWCDVGLCKWSEVLKRYENLINADCSAYFCSRDNGAFMITPIHTFTMTLFSLVLTAIAHCGTYQ